ncbi:uncharacterized protein LOC113273151 [Papaver somniferum]|uniref:uncharacterized protein LOC113273151 n=1 Tax=Papaver somniferum TaxID=3469 RepID=UPI000E705EDE|nr:uncharacterized protein LOC113273151 [Papaver somniferum]
MLRCIDLCDSVKIEPEALSLQNDVTQSGEKQTDETSCRGKEYSHVYELQTKEEVLNMYENVEQGKGWGCSEERPSQHGLPSQNHLEMSKKPYVNLVSDDHNGESPGESEDSVTSANSKAPLSDLKDMMAVNNWNWNIGQEIKWEFEADMLSSFEEDTELSMKAVCALYRQHIAEVEISTKGLFHYGDALRYVKD